LVQGPNKEFATIRQDEPLKKKGATPDKKIGVFGQFDSARMDRAD
jgi:hypothetical protein